MTRDVMRRASAAALLVALFVAACAAAPPPPLHCADGKLPCPDQVTAFRCDEVSEGEFPPDADEIRFILSGAKVPPSGEPTMTLTTRCAGVIEAAGAKIHVELFEGFEGGWMKVPGAERVWFQTPPEAPNATRARVCVDVPLPEIDASRGAKCHAVGSAHVDEATVLDCLAHAKPSPGAWIMTPAAPYAWCEVGLTGGASARVDLFAGGEGWWHLAGEKRACFTTTPWR